MMFLSSYPDNWSHRPYVWIYKRWNYITGKDSDRLMDIITVLTFLTVFIHQIVDPGSLGIKLLWTVLTLPIVSFFYMLYRTISMKARRLRGKDERAFCCYVREGFEQIPPIMLGGLVYYVFRLVLEFSAMRAFNVYDWSITYFFYTGFQYYMDGGNPSLYSRIKDKVKNFRFSFGMKPAMVGT